MKKQHSRNFLQFLVQKAATNYPTAKVHYFEFLNLDMKRVHSCRLSVNFLNKFINYSTTFEFVMQ